MSTSFRRRECRRTRSRPGPDESGRADAASTAYGWVDRKAGIAHIPVERAMDILAKTGLPKVAALAVAGVPPRTFIPPGTKREEPKLPDRSAAIEAGPETRQPHDPSFWQRCSSWPSWPGGSASVAGAGDRGQRGEPGGLRPEAGRAAPARPPLP